MYVGHKSETGKLQPLIDHLMETGRLAGEFAEVFGAKDWGNLAGLAHDIGKYSKEFQKRILENGPKVDHSTAGGKELAKMKNTITTYCVLGHHGGLPDGGSRSDVGDTPTMHGRIKRETIPDYSEFKKEIELFTVQRPPIKPIGKGGFSASFFIRMLFSCLVDADFLDTETFMSDGTVKRGGYDTIDILHQSMQEHIKQFENPKTELHIKRNEILKQCTSKGQDEPGLYSLTVPTGGGKTISSLAFALEHAKEHGMERIIYVIPYTSIIEQNAAVFRSILGERNVVEHHFNVDYNDKDDSIKDNEADLEMERKRLSTENWDAPVIVTTNVQFFESLFASKTSKCRKLHNIANSVIIFDEAQMIPLPYLMPCVSAISELVLNYKSTCVLCSATQPALDSLLPDELNRMEICYNPQDLYDFFKRTTVKQIGKLDDEELSFRLMEEKQVLCIVNSRKQAQNVYKLLYKDEAYHLSTLMYPEHRSRTLEEIKGRLKNHQACRVISTSLIEAGVDVDFPAVYRQRTGVDSVIQAAGRCNREGRRDAEDSIVYVFDSAGDYVQPNSIKQLAETFNITARRHEDIASLEAIKAYFQKLYQFRGEALDQYNIMNKFEEKVGIGSFPFREIAKKFKLIDSETHTILIPLEENAKEYANRLRSGERSIHLHRAMSRYCVNVYPHHYYALDDIGAIEILDEGIAILADLNCYDKAYGLTMEPEGGNALFLP